MTTVETPEGLIEALRLAVLSGSSDRIRECVRFLQKLPTVEVAHALSALPEEALLALLPYFTEEQQGLIVSDLPRDKQLAVFKGMGAARFARIFVQMDPAERVDFFQALSAEDQALLLPYLPWQVRQEVLELSKYPEETAGGSMTTNFATVSPEMTVQEAIDHLRRSAPRKMIYYIYVVDADQRLLGVVTLRQLVLADLDQRIADLMLRDIVAVRVDEDREQVARLVDEYDLLAIPVVNQAGQLVGIVTHEQVIDILREEQSEDVEKIMGIMPEEEEEPTETFYIGVPFWTHLRKRLPWLLLLAFLQLLTAGLLARFERVLASVTALVFFMPLIAGMGGNSASQASASVIRALALREVTPRLWWRVLLRELGLGFLLGLIVAMAVFVELVVVAWWVGESFPVGGVLRVVVMALLLQTTISTGLGAGLPLLLDVVGVDPAVASSPLLATLLDVIGIVIYFGLASVLLFSEWGGLG